MQVGGERRAPLCINALMRGVIIAARLLLSHRDVRTEAGEGQGTGNLGEKEREIERERERERKRKRERGERRAVRAVLERESVRVSGARRQNASIGRRDVQNGHVKRNET